MQLVKPPPLEPTSSSADALMLAMALTPWSIVLKLAQAPDSVNEETLLGSGSAIYNVEQPDHVRPL